MFGLNSEYFFNAVDDIKGSANGIVGLAKIKELVAIAGFPRDLVGLFRLALKYCNSDGQDGLTWAEVQQCVVKRIEINHYFQMKMEIFLTFLFH